MQPIDWDEVMRGFAKGLEPMLWKLKNAELILCHLSPLSFEEWQALQPKRDIWLEYDVMQDYVDYLRYKEASHE